MVFSHKDVFPIHISSATYIHRVDSICIEWVWQVSFLEIPPDHSLQDFLLIRLFLFDRTLGSRGLFLFISRIKICQLGTLSFLGFDYYIFYDSWGCRIRIIVGLSFDWIYLHLFVSICCCCYFPNGFKIAISCKVSAGLGFYCWIFLRFCLFGMNWVDLAVQFWELKIIVFIEVWSMGIPVLFQTHLVLKAIRQLNWKWDSYSHLRPQLHETFLGCENQLDYLG